MTVRSFIAASSFARAGAFPGRAKTAARHMATELSLTSNWLLSSREHTNYTYNLDPRNLEHLAWWVSGVTNAPTEDCRAWIREALQNEQLISHVEGAVRQSSRRGLADREVRMGRRAGWYSVIRALRPTHVVETGTDKGLGSVVIASALLRNGEGRLTTMDINPEAGYLVTGAFAEVTTKVIGDSVRSIRELSSTVNLFIHDSDHSEEHEDYELSAIENALSADARVLSDNAHATNSLMNWANRTGRRFSFFQEVPEKHWYPGAGIGAAW